ncbi:alpha-1,6-glucosidase domain-containing protein [Undibacterium sp. Ji42W]|uniref:alpha-1,6-glucosidase domain-containing protein n=1 Tax=Undibacterium sp. Ji42W TaxID=3413039 RepID=UPI003BF083BD
MFFEQTIAHPKSYRSFLMVCALTTCVATCGSHAVASNVSDTRIATCNAGQFESTLSPAAIPATKAHAYWLSSKLIRWPGLAAGNKVKLYLSRMGQLKLSRDTKPDGFDEVVVLTESDTALDSDIAKRFDFTKPGKVVELSSASLQQLRSLHQSQVMLVTEDSEGTKHIIEFRKMVVALHHVGVDILRSKSMDSNSYNSGDWFNRLDWNYGDNYFATGLPPEKDNAQFYPYIKAALKQANSKPTRADITYRQDQFRDLLQIRASSSLFRLSTASDISQRQHFYNTGPTQNPLLIAAHLDVQTIDGSKF